MLHRRRERRGDATPGDLSPYPSGLALVLHIYGMVVVMSLAVRVGATVISMPRFEIEPFLGLMQEHRATGAYLVPPIVLALAKHPIVDEYDLSSLRWIISGAAPRGKDLAAATRARLGGRRARETRDNRPDQ